MQIHKVINNNVLSSYNRKNQEIVIMGKGIGFKAKAGDTVDESKIEKIFCIENGVLSKEFEELIANIPLEHMQISVDIISYAKNECGLKLNQSIYIALTDHINYAIERYRQGMQLPNGLLAEIRQFYHKEYLVGEYALRLLGERLDVHFLEDEAGFIALHFLNAEYDTDIRGIHMIADIIQQCRNILKDEFGEKIDVSTIHYERFLTHLKFFAHRYCQKQPLRSEDKELIELIQKKYTREFACGYKMVSFIEKDYGTESVQEEAVCMAIHIRRILKKDD